MAVSYSFDENGNELLPEHRSVTWVNNYIKALLEEERQLQDVFISAEISNFKYHSTGHMYFTLKDENSEIRAVMFRAYASKTRFKPENGMKVLVHARIGVYEKAGAYQLYVDAMQPDGIGALYLAYEQLKEKLAAEGLFDQDKKKPIPKFPQRIGVITSPTGAAVRDIIKVSKKRCPYVELVIFPSAVQGVNAPEELTRAVEYLNAINNVDLIIIGRGGGSIEDLWAFNDEGLARAIYNSNIPIISAVGHEIDYTICDFVADMRAATPSHAAELATPDVSELKRIVSALSERAYGSIKHLISNYRSSVQMCEQSRALKSPLSPFDTKRIQLLTIAENISGTMKSKISEYKLLLAKSSSALNALSPLNVLSRGYGAVFNLENKVLKGVNCIAPKDDIVIKMYDGTIDAVVKSVKREDV